MVQNFKWLQERVNDVLMSLFYSCIHVCLKNPITEPDVISDGARRRDRVRGLSAGEGCEGRPRARGRRGGQGPHSRHVVRCFNCKMRSGKETDSYFGGIESAYFSF